jgi:hypothetical protein
VLVRDAMSGMNSYDIAGELPGGASYRVQVRGPIPSEIFRHVVSLISLSADFLEEDEREACRPMELGDLMGVDHAE